MSLSSSSRGSNSRGSNSRGSNSLGPADVGHRVVVRRLLRGETGPSGGPAMTDVLGDLEAWEAGVLRVRRGNGELVSISVADIVSGKRVPPPPTRRR